MSHMAKLSRHVTLMCIVVNSAVCSSGETENDKGKAKSRDTRTTNCEAGMRERPVNLFILALPLLLSFLVCHFFLAVTSHKPFFTLFFY